MKTLLILRHAKSSWKDESLADHDRPLNERGKRDAPRMGRLLASQGLEPQRILCSTAVRAHKTANKVVQSAGLDADIELLPEFYLAAPTTYVEVVRRQSDEAGCLMLVGHNPGMAELLYMLTSHDDPFPTAALAEIDADIESWQDLNPDTQCSLRNLWRPKELGPE